MLIYLEVRTGLYRLYDNVTELTSCRISDLETNNARLFQVKHEVVPSRTVTWDIKRVRNVADEESEA
jgi:hypothetical protein